MAHDRWQKATVIRAEKQSAGSVLAGQEAQQRQKDPLSISAQSYKGPAVADHKQMGMKGTVKDSDTGLQNWTSWVVLDNAKR